jgi:hypothetical protein
MWSGFFERANRRARLDRSHEAAVGAPALRAAGSGAFGRLSGAAGARRRRGGDAQQQQAVVERDGSCYAYRHTQKGVQVALLFLFFHKCLCSPTAAPDRCDVHGLFYGSRPPSLRMNPKRVQRLMRLMAFWPLGRSRAGASPATQHKVFPYPFARGFACDITYVRIGTGFFYLVATPSTDAKRAPQSLPGSPSKIVGARFHHRQDPPHELTAGSKPLITAPTPPSNGSIDLLAAA